MRLILEPTDHKEARRSGISHSRIIIERPSDDLTIVEMFDDVINPALMAWGYSPETVREHTEPEYRVAQPPRFTIKPSELDDNDLDFNYQIGRR
jgi:hypothetical protein